MYGRVVCHSLEANYLFLLSDYTARGKKDLKPSDSS